MIVLADVTVFQCSLVTLLNVVCRVLDVDLCNKTGVATVRTERHQTY